MLRVGKWRSLLIFRAKAASGRVLYTKVFLKTIFAIFTGKHLCQCLSFNKVAGFSLQLNYKGDSGTGVFP